MSERLVGYYALQRRARIVQDRLAMGNEHDLDRPVEHPTEFLADPSRSLLVRRPPFRWHPEAALAIVFDHIAEHDDAPVGKSEYRFAPLSLAVVEDRSLDAIGQRLAGLPNIPVTAFGEFVRRTPVPRAREQDAHRQVTNPLAVTMERTPELIRLVFRNERINENKGIASLGVHAPHVPRPHALGPPRRMRCRPSPQAGANLCKFHRVLLEARAHPTRLSASLALARYFRAELPPNAVRRSKTTGVVMHQKGAVRLEHEQTYGLRKSGGQATGVEHLAASDEQTHRTRTVLSLSDRTFYPARLVRLGWTSGVRLEEAVMYAVVRSYSGEGASELFDQLEQRNDEVKELIGGVPGFVSYTACRSGEGGVTVTVCQDKTGTDESSRRAAEWVKENVSATAKPPAVTEGSTVVHFTS